MTTLDRLTADLTTSMKARDAFRTNTLRQIIAAVRTEETAGSAKRELTEEEILKVLAREVKKRRESVQIYTDAGASDRAKTEADEAELIETYLPTRLTAAELETLVDAVIADLGASSMKDMGGVMKEATARADGRADGGALSALVKSRLAGA